MADKLVAGPLVATFPVPRLPQSNPPVLCTLIPITVLTLIPIAIAVQAPAVPMASAPVTPAPTAPTTLPLGDENTIQHFKECHENNKLRNMRYSRKKRKHVKSSAGKTAVKTVAVKTVAVKTVAAKTVAVKKVAVKKAAVKKVTRAFTLLLRRSK